MIKVKRFTPGRIVVFVILSLFTVTFCAGLLWIIVNSFKEDIQFYTGAFFAFPKPFLVRNYVDAFAVLAKERFDLTFMIFNSIWYSVGGVVLLVFTNNVVAYILARFSFPGRNIIYWTYFFTMMLTVVGSMPSSLKVYKMMGVYDSPTFLFTRIMAGGSNLFMFYATYKTQALTYSEAAYIDGAGHYTVYFKIMLPQSVGMCIAIGVMSFISLWNDYMLPLVYVPHWPTLAAGLYKLSLIAERKWLEPYLLAGIVISSIPIVVLFVMFQKQLLQLNFGGGLKG